jgi:hypothetical protein
MERNMALSVIVSVQLAASGDQLELHKAANQFLCLPAQTRGLLLEAQGVLSLEFPPAVLLH